MLPNVFHKFLHGLQLVMYNSINIKQFSENFYSKKYSLPNLYCENTSTSITVKSKDVDISYNYKHNNNSKKSKDVHILKKNNEKTYWWHYQTN